jgi:NhaP-type Na+/H+ or K+/H+ antiporter
MLNPGMEVGSFFLWALIPYWICDGMDWSGIVSIVTMGFFMDVYVAAPQEQESDVMPVDTVQADGSRSLVAALSNVTDPQDSNSALPFGSPASPTSPPTGDYTKMEDKPEDKTVVTYFSDGRRVMPASIYRLNILRLLIHRDRIRLSEEADKHVRFVAHLLAQLCENAIFAYLGLFLFSGNYEWDVPLVTISVVICIVSRFLMVSIICGAIWYINILRRGVTGCGYENEQNVSRTAVQLRNKNTQIVLMWAGLRGAVSLALVENIPLFNQVTKEGCEFKPVLKAMTSATIIFTTFIFGGSAYYVFPKLGIKPDKPQDSRGSISRESEASEPFEMVNEIIVTDGSTPPRRGYEMRNMSEMTIEKGVMS